MIFLPYRTMDRLLFIIDNKRIISKRKPSICISSYFNFVDGVWSIPSEPNLHCSVHNSKEFNLVFWGPRSFKY